MALGIRDVVHFDFMDPPSKEVIVNIIKKWEWIYIRNKIICLLHAALRGYYTPNQKVACFVLYLKIINTVMKNYICIL